MISSRTTWLRGFCTRLCTLLALVPLAFAGTAQAETDVAAPEEGPYYHGAMGIAAGGLTLLYAPAKILYATAGMGVGGLAYLWSVGDHEMMSRVMQASMGGDFVITPSHLRGEKNVEFLGR
ncbi:MAG: hypothetical protein MJE66_04580 [Proteobacteria bacterium]|nr:hypothetical protein [Pseudomonadota bacterium]